VLKNFFPSVHRQWRAFGPRNSRLPISTNVEIMWKISPPRFGRQTSGWPQLLPKCPGVPLRCAPRICWLTQRMCETRAGLSTNGVEGASEKCAKGFTAVHTRFTVFPHGHRSFCAQGLAAFSRIERANARLVCLPHALSTARFRARELVDTERIGADQQTLALHENCHSFELRAIGRVDAVGRAPVPFAVEAKEPALISGAAD
jgi:hypothetical protein